MAQFVIESVPARLAGNTYYLDEEESHIEVNQELARTTGAGALLKRVCPAKVYSVEADGTVGVEYAAALSVAPAWLLHRRACSSGTTRAVVSASCSARADSNP